MSNKLKEIDIKNCVQYFFNDMTSTKNLDSKKIMMDKKP